MKSEDPDLDRLLKMTMHDRPGSSDAACLDAEQLAAWSSGSLAGDEAAAAELHLSNCARCQAMLATFARTEAPVPAAEPFWRRLSMGWLIPLTAAAAAALLIWIAIPSRTPAPALETATVRAELPPAPAPTPPAATAPELQNAPTPAAPPPPAAAKAQPESRTDALSSAAPEPTPGAEPVTPARAFSAAPSAPPSPAPPAPAPAPAPPPPADAGRQTDQQAQSGRPGLVGGLAGGPVGQGQGRGVGLGQGQRQPQAAAPAVALNRAAVAAPIEFASPALTDSVTVSGSSPIVAGRGGPAAGGGGGRGGGRGGGAAGAQARSTAEAVALSTRWRILPGGTVERSVTNGATWEPIAIDPPALVTGGVAPSAQVCWLIARGGVVLRTTDRLRFERVPFPDATDLSSIRATDALQASVTTADGRVFTTTDGGATWR